MWVTLKYIIKIIHMKKIPLTGSKYFSIINIVSTKQTHKELKLSSHILVLANFSNTLIDVINTCDIR